MKNVILCLLLLATPAMAAKNRTECQLPADQGVGSLHASWERLPITLVFDSEFYARDNGRAMKAFRKAVGTWNEWAARKGKVAFVIANDQEGLEIPQVTECAKAAYTKAGYVGVWKIGSEGWRQNQRESCGTQANGLPGRLLSQEKQASTDWLIERGRIGGASILFNFEDFNVPGKYQIDLESLMLHELGSTLGLLHSCNGSTGDSIDPTSAPACSAELPADYLNAVMFPFLDINQKRRKLGQNDYDRINCLY